jgi:hypothetical protein
MSPENRPRIAEVNAGAPKIKARQVVAAYKKKATPGISVA